MGGKTQIQKSKARRQHKNVGRRDKRERRRDRGAKRGKRIKMNEKKIKDLIEDTKKALDEARKWGMESFFDGQLSAFEDIAAILKEEREEEAKEKRNKHLTLVKCSITLGCTWWEDEKNSFWRFEYCSGSSFCTHPKATDPPVTMDIIPEMLAYLAKREVDEIEIKSIIKSVDERRKKQWFRRY